MFFMHWLVEKKSALMVKDQLTSLRKEKKKKQNRGNQTKATKEAANLVLELPFSFLVALFTEYIILYHPLNSRVLVRLDHYLVVKTHMFFTYAADSVLFRIVLAVRHFADVVNRLLYQYLLLNWLLRLFDRKYFQAFESRYRRIAGRGLELHRVHRDARLLRLWHYWKMRLFHHCLLLYGTKPEPRLGKWLLYWVLKVWPLWIWSLEPSRSSRAINYRLSILDIILVKVPHFYQRLSNFNV